MQIGLMFIIGVLAIVHLYSWYHFSSGKENLEKEAKSYTDLTQKNWNLLISAANVSPKNELATSIWLNSGLDKQFNLGPIIRRIKVVRTLNELDTTRLFKDKIIQYDEAGNYCINLEKLNEVCEKKSINDKKDILTKELCHIIDVTNSLKNHKTTQNESELRITGVEILNQHIC